MLNKYIRGNFYQFMNDLGIKSSYHAQNKLICQLQKTCHTKFVTWHIRRGIRTKPQIRKAHSDLKSVKCKYATWKETWANDKLQYIGVTCVWLWSECLRPFLHPQPFPYLLLHLWLESSGLAKKGQTLLHPKYVLLAPCLHNLPIRH